MGTNRRSRATTLRLILFAGVLLLLAIANSFASDELYLIISPSSPTFPEGGFIDFDGYIYNASAKRVDVPAPYGGFNVVWKVHDLCKVRPDREGSDASIGTHTVEPYMIDPKSAVRCEHLGAQFDAEPGDVLEFYITIERKLKAGAGQTIRSNSVVLYRPQ